MRISDWSSDVCSSDLTAGAEYPTAPRRGLPSVPPMPSPPRGRISPLVACCSSQSPRHDGRRSVADAVAIIVRCAPRLRSVGPDAERIRERPGARRRQAELQPWGRLMLWHLAALAKLVAFDRPGAIWVDRLELLEKD